MEPINRMLGDSPQSTVSALQMACRSTTGDQQGEPSTLSDDHMALLWQRMTEIYGHRWVSAYGERWSPTWQKGLTGITPGQVRIAIGRCLSGEMAWPPTLPEFKALCHPRPEDLGIPDLEAAWREALDIACRRKRREACSHPVVWHALAEAGDIGHMPEDKGRKAFEYAYRRTVDMAMAGEPLREIPKALPKPEDATITPEQRRKWAADGIAKLNAITGRSSP